MLKMRRKKKPRSTDGLLQFEQMDEFQLKIQR